MSSPKNLESSLKYGETFWIPPNAETALSKAKSIARLLINTLGGSRRSGIGGASVWLNEPTKQNPDQSIVASSDRMYNLINLETISSGSARPS